jgi:hypothetical protein
MANGAITSALLEWGTSTNLDAATPALTLPADFNTNRVTVTLTNLPAGTAFYYRAVATNTLGVTRGSILRFETVAPPVLRAGAAASGPFSFDFTGTNGLAYQVYASTNLSQWISLGTPTGLPSNQFRFIDSSSTNFPRRFYRVLTP